MAEFYFNKFPIINYANTVCRDITKRAVLDLTLKNTATAFDRYTIKRESRADSIAENYYEDPYYEWLIYLTNGIIDPYYGWNLTADDFNNHIVKKYKSLENAQDKIIYYQNNWTEDDQELSVSFYNNNLPASLKKYYSPDYNNGSNILSYKRKQDDSKVNTNQIIDISFDLLTTDKEFSLNEILDIFDTNSNLIGQGEIIYVDTSAIKIKNISGNTSIVDSVLLGRDSAAEATLTSSIVAMKNIPDDEAVFWHPVSYYTYESEINEKNKNILLLDERYAMQVAEDLRKSLKV
jgi:hypothetical protein